MKLTLTFELPEERDEALLAVHAADLWSTLFDLDNDLRGEIKHGEPNSDRLAALMDIRELLHEREDDKHFVCRHQHSKNQGGNYE